MTLTFRPASWTPMRAIVVAALVVACSSPGSPSTAPTTVPSGTAPAASATPGPSIEPTAVPSSTPLPDPSSIAAIPPTEGVLNTVWLGEDRVVVGGFAGPGFVPTILVFREGTWSVAQVPETVGQVAAIVESGGTLFAVGNTLPDERTGFIWTSPDGLAWTEAQTVADAALYDVAANDGAVVAVGALLTDEMVATAAAWVWTDGSAWERADVEGATRTPMGSVTATSTGFAATGDRPLGDDRPFWTASQPATWTAVENDLDTQYLPVDIEAWGERIVIVGASGRPGDQHPFLAVTSDGRQWEQRLLSDAAEGYASAVTVVRDTPYIAAVDADVLTLFVPSGQDVMGIAIEPMGASIGALRWDPDRGLVGVGSKDNMHAVWLLPTS